MFNRARVDRFRHLHLHLHLPYRDADVLHAALSATMGDLPPGLLRSIT